METRALWMPGKRGFLKAANSELCFGVQQFHFQVLDPCTLSCKQYHRDIFYTWLLSSFPHAEVIFMPSPFSFSCLHNSAIFKHICTYRHPYFPGKQNPRMSPWLPGSLPLAFEAIILYINLILKQTFLFWSVIAFLCMPNSGVIPRRHPRSHSQSGSPGASAAMPASKCLSWYLVGTNPHQHIPDLPPGIIIISHCNWSWSQLIT